MEQILDLPVQEERPLQYANFGYRFLAALIDGITLWGVQFLLTILLNNANSMDLARILTIAYFGMDVLYFAIMESSEYQATLGKMALGIRVGNAYGGRISFLNAIGRYFAKFISAIILMIGYLMALWDDKNQALHDKLADTYVFVHKA